MLLKRRADNREPQQRYHPSLYSIPRDSAHSGERPRVTNPSKRAEQTPPMRVGLRQKEKRPGTDGRGV
jgi:hypothetical protein